MENPIVILNEKIQKKFATSPIWTAPIKIGPDHLPTITVEVSLPNGRKYKGVGSNQRLARQEAAKEALKDL